ncbi:hypothetical protein PROPHIGD20-1_112 [Mycobacterium phage prophiGD20-1]|nr:hypothetical protein PROPHIGD20-1_112 [Mycobacterium phage prophiGD20-1]
MKRHDTIQVGANAEKRCPRCETVKPVTAFSVDRNRKSGRNCCPFSNDLSHSHLICRNRVSFSFDLSYAS